MSTGCRGTPPPILANVSVTFTAYRFSQVSASHSATLLEANGHAAWQHGIDIQHLAGVSVTLRDALGGALADNFLRVSA